MIYFRPLDMKSENIHYIYNLCFWTNMIGKAWVGKLRFFEILVFNTFIIIFLKYIGNVKEFQRIEELLTNRNYIN